MLMAQKKPSHVFVDPQLHSFSGQVWRCRQRLSDDILNLVDLVDRHKDMGVSENRLNPIFPNGFADRYPVFKWLAIITQWLMIVIPIKWLFHWEYTQHFQVQTHIKHDDVFQRETRSKNLHCVTVVFWKCITRPVNFKTWQTIGISFNTYSICILCTIHVCRCSKHL